MQQRDPRTYNTWRIALDEGRIEPIEALLRWTYVAMARRVMDLEEYTRLVTKTLPKVEWHQPGEELEVLGYMPVTWTCATDFFEWADSYLGHIFSLGTFLREYIAEYEPEKRERMVKSKQAEIARIREENPGATQREIAEVAGVTQGRVSQLLSIDNNQAESSYRKAASQRQAARQIYLPKDAGQAATKIRAKFGAEFTQQLKEAL